MARTSFRSRLSLPKRANILEARWQRLCDLYLPRAPKDSMWRYDKEKRHHQPSSGWKLHISATILNAPIVLKRVAPFLAAHGVGFKAPRSLFEVGKLNSGLDYPYSQIGKIITVYPRDDNEALFLARRLEKLTRGLPAPSIPFDLRFSDSANVYYRFGAFQHLEITQNGRQVAAAYTPDGKLIQDTRDQPKPDGVVDPFVAHRLRSRSAKPKSVSAIRVLKVLSQRGKGGVYAAVDFATETPRLCLLKEGRKHGEVSWDGHDGAWRVRNEKRVLTHLHARGVPVPRVLSSLNVSGNYYLVMEYLDGEALHDKLISRRQRLSLLQVLEYGIQLAEFMSRMHSAGWAWGDCKPKNIIVTRDGRLVPIDFEGATPITRRDDFGWATPGFTPPAFRGRARDGADKDLYALASMLFLLLTGRVFDAAEPVTIQKLRRNVPPELRELVRLLLADEEKKRFSATAVHRTLISISRNLKRQSTPLMGAKAA